MMERLYADECDDEGKQVLNAGVLA